MENEEISQPRMSVDLNAVKHNYEELRKKANGAEVCPVVKSNAYGLGALEMVKALRECGCKNFYVSTAKEGADVRKKFPDIQINVLNGPSEQTMALFRAARLTPVLNNPEQLEIWEKGKSKNSDTGCIINIETGFNRLGFKEQDWPLLTPERLRENKVSLVMSHLSCAGDDQSDPLVQKQNKHQFDVYKKMLKNFEGIPGSLALDAMMVNNSGAKISQIRSGAALCGINVWPGKLNLEPVMTIEAPVLQTEQIKKGDTVGYGATFTAQTDTKIAVIGIGYSNGIPRSLSNKGKVFFSDGDNMYEAPIVGRISMGLLNCDVTNVPEKALRTKKASIINKKYTINDLCVDADRLDSEIMCSFSAMDVKYVSNARDEKQKTSQIGLLKKNCLGR